MSLNDDRHVIFIHVSTWITLCTDLVHIVEIIEIAYGTSWTSRRKSMKLKGDEVELYLPKISVIIYTPQIAGRKGGNVIGAHQDSLR